MQRHVTFRVVMVATADRHFDYFILILMWVSQCYIYLELAQVKSIIIIIIIIVQYYTI